MAFSIVDSSRAAVLSRLRLEDHLHILSLGRELPLKTVSWKIAKIGLLLCFYVLAI